MAGKSKSKLAEPAHMFAEWREAAEAEMRAIGTNWTQVCKLGKISRATPDRWKVDLPAVGKMQEVYEIIQAMKAASLAGGAQ